MNVNLPNFKLNKHTIILGLTRFQRGHGITLFCRNLATMMSIYENKRKYMKIK